MKKGSLAMLAATMVFGFSPAAGAAPVLTFDLDFYGGDTSLAQGVLDTGATIDLAVGESVMVDLLFSITDVSLWKAGWDVRFPADNLVASNLFLDGWIPYPDDPQGITPGHVRFRGQSSEMMGKGPGENLLLGTFELTCTGVSLDEIWLYDYNPDGPDWAAGIVYGGIILDALVVPTHLASVNNVVPVPGAVWLLGSGLAGLVALRRRMKN